MPHLSGSRAILVCAAAAAVFGLAAPQLSAAGTKVPNGDQIKGKLKPLYNGQVSPDNNAEREKVFIEIEKILQKDQKQNVAMKTPEFWVEAAQENRFSGGPRKLGKLKATVSEEITYGPDDKKKAKMWFRGGGLVSATKPAPLLVSILPADVDPKAWIEGTWAAAANEEIVKNWVVVAMNDSPEFPVLKDPALVMEPFAEAIERFAIDGNRWYLEGVDGACESVQAAATKFLAPRLAGLILRGAEKAVTNTNSALFPTVVVHSKTTEKATAVVEEYKKLDERASAIVLDDVNQVRTMTDQLLGWFGQHPRRVLPASYTFTTTLTENEGEQWTGSLFIASPSKRGAPTKVTVKYIRDKQMVDIQSENLSEFRLYMNDELLDLDKEVSVYVNGTKITSKEFERSLREMLELADQWGDWGRMFPASVRGVVPVNMTSAAPPEGPDGKDQPPAPPAGEGGQPAPPK